MRLYDVSPAGGEPKRSMSSIDRLEEEIDKYDVDGNGVIDASEVQNIVDALVAEESKGRSLRTFGFGLAALVAFVLVCNVGMAFAVVNLTRQTSLDDGVLVVADTGEAVQTMSTEFHLDQDGVLRVSAPIGNNSEEATGRRRLSQLQQQGGAVVMATLTNDDGVMVTSTGAMATTSPLTDDNGVMLSSDGSPVRSQVASYTTELNFVGGLAVLFGLDKEELKSITGWTVTAEDTTKINLQILSVERESAEVELDLASREELSVMAGDAATLKVTLLRFVTNHYEYSMLAIMRMGLLDATGAELDGSDRYDTRLIERGDEMELSLQGLSGNVTFGSGRRLKFCCSAIVDFVEDTFNAAKDEATRAYNNAKNAATNEFKGWIRSATEFLDDALAKAREVWNLVESLPGHISGIPDMIVKALRDLPWLPSPEDLLDGMTSVLTALLPLEGSPPGICLPFCKLAALGSGVQVFAGNEVYLYEDFNYQISTTLNNMKACFQIRDFSLSASKLGRFLQDIFEEALLPILDSLAEELKAAFESMLSGIKDAVSGIQSASADVKRFLEDFTNSINGLLGRRRRALLADVHAPASREEIEQVVDEWVEETVTRAASRKLLQLDGKSGPQMPFGELSDHQLARHLEQTAEDMMEHGHAHVRRALTEGIARRQLLDWSNLAALERMTIGIALNFEQTLNIVSSGAQLKYKSGDLLDLAGEGGPDLPLTQKVEYMVLPGVSIIGEVLIDMQLPWDIMVEGATQVAVTINLKDIAVLVDVIHGSVSASPGDFTASGINLAGGALDDLFSYYATGRVELKMLVMVAFRLCFFGNCLSFETRARQYYGVGFDTSTGTCDAGSGDACGANTCASYVNPASRNYIKTYLTDDVEYPEGEFQCIADSAGAYAAGGLWVHAPYPSLVGRLDFPAKLAGSLIGGGDCDFAGGALDDMINDLDTQLFNFNPSQPLVSKVLGSFCEAASAEADLDRSLSLTSAREAVVDTVLPTNLNLPETGAVVMSPKVAYVGCYSEDGGRGFPNVINTGVTMTECIAAAVKSGATSFGLQHPAGFETAGEVECWFGDFAAGKTKVSDQECQVEAWAAFYDGVQYPYHGAASRNAVYQLSAPIRYLGCWSEDSGRAFTQVTGDLTMEGCAAWAASRGYDRFGLQHPEGHNDNLVECWTGPFDAGKPRVGDEECKGEGWDPVYQGTTFSYNGRANRNAVYRLGGSAAAFTGCWSDSNGRSLPNSVSDVTMDGCAAAARREGSLLFGLQYPEGYGDDRIECWFGEMDASREQRPDAECKGEDWLPRLNGEKAPFNGAASRNAIYALDPGPALYVGCWSEGAGRAFPVIIRDVTMEGCAAAALAEGSARFGLQYPEGYGDNRIECWYGAFDASKPRVDNSECKAEGWDPTYRGFTFKYNGAGSINAVYQLAAPARYMGCYSEDSGRAFSDVIQGVTMEACAAATRAKGSAWFGLQHPQGHAGETVECWIGAFDAGKPKVADSECKGEGWNPTAWGRQYKYNGAGNRNAVYVLTQPARYVGCWSESPGRVFSTVISGVTMETCAAAALGAGSSRFGLQHPAGFGGEEVECWFGEFNPNLGAKVADSACKGESWNPSLHGASFTYNGAGGHNAIYEFFG